MDEVSLRHAEWPVGSDGHADWLVTRGSYRGVISLNLCHFVPISQPQSQHFSQMTGRSFKGPGHGFLFSFF